MTLTYSTNTTLDGGDWIYPALFKDNDISISIALVRDTLDLDAAQLALLGGLSARSIQDYRATEIRMFSDELFTLDHEATVTITAIGRYK
jgi:hypothetical protein